MSGALGSLLMAFIVGAIVRAVFGKRSSPPVEHRQPVDLRSPVERRADSIEGLLKRGELDDAVHEGRAWLREIDAGQEAGGSVSAGCLASILEAQLRRLPERLDVASSFGEALLSLLIAKPSGGKRAKLRTLGALAVAADASGDAAAVRNRFEAVVELSESMDNIH